MAEPPSGEECVLAVDVGTTACKVAVVGRSGALHAAASAAYDAASSVLEPAAGVAEQRPAAWWDALAQAVAQLSIPAEMELSAVALSGMMQCLILLDESGNVLRDAMLHTDARASAEAEALEEKAGGADAVRAQLPSWKGALSFPARLLWLRKREPGKLDEAATMLLGAHDYLALRLCGKVASDPVTASTTGLLGPEGRYNLPLLKELLPDVDLEKLLPPLLRGDERLGAVDAQAAEALGLVRLAGLPLFHGCGDAGSATCGVGAGVPGAPYAYVGTSGWVAVTLPRSAPRPAAAFSLEHPCDDQLVISAAPIMTAGGNLDLLRNLLFPPEAGYEEVCACAAESQPGSGGLLYLPWLSGERAPFLDPNARGCYLGLTPNSSRADMCRAVLEGVAYSFRALLEVVLPGSAGNGGGLLVAGGPAKSSLWMQTFADVLQMKVRVLDQADHVGTRGVALLAAKGLGWQASLRPADSFFPTAGAHEPSASLAALHAGRYQVHASLHSALEGSFRALAEIQSTG